MKKQYIEPAIRLQAMNGMEEMMAALSLVYEDAQVVLGKEDDIWDEEDFDAEDDF